LGKQRSKILTKKAEEIYKIFPDRFTTDFEENKKALNELKIFTTKIDRNIIAGHLVKLVKEKKP